MIRKIIYGVNHNLEDGRELDLLLGEIEKHEVKSAGLELPQDYLELRSFGITYKYFNDVEEYLHGRNIGVFPLDNPELFFENYSICVVKNIFEGRGDENKLREKVKNLKFKVDRLNYYTPPEISYFLLRDYKIFSKALDIIDCKLSKEEVNGLWKEINMKREEKMIEVIEGNKPDIVVVGLGHAYPLKERLPEYEIVNIVNKLGLAKV